MNHTLIPGICGLSLLTMLGFAGKHWMEIRDEVTAFHTRSLPAPPSGTRLPAQPTPRAEKPGPAALPPIISESGAEPTVSETVMTRRTPSESEQEFYELLIEKLKSLEQQNNELRDQIAEANRGQLELEFRFDTLSSSFRPLRVMEDAGTALESNELSPSGSTPGVLPPRAIIPADDLPAY